MLSLLYLGVKAGQYFVSSSHMFLDKKTLLQIWHNPGLKLTIFRGTGSRTALFSCWPRMQTPQTNVLTQDSYSFELLRFHDFFHDLFKFSKTLGLAVTFKNF